jgi:hypothetical protein
LQRDNVEHHWTPKEKPGRTFKPGVQIRKPACNGRLGREDHGVVGAAMKSDRCTGAGNGCHFCASKSLRRFTQRMVNSRLRLSPSVAVHGDWRLRWLVQSKKRGGANPKAIDKWRTCEPSYMIRGRRRSSVSGNSAEFSSGGTSNAPGVWPWSWKRARRRASASKLLTGKVS